MQKARIDSDSDSEDDALVQQFLDATDPKFFSNTMYQTPQVEVEPAGKEIALKTDQILASALNVTHKEELKSQRYLSDECMDSVADLNFSETVQNQVFKKLTYIINQQVEYCHFPASDAPRKHHKKKSKIKLVKDADCYVTPYEDFKYANEGPQQKPIIKKRCLEESPNSTSRQEMFGAVAVSGYDILDGIEVKHWAQKPVRSEKFFRYKINKHGVYCSQSISKLDHSKKSYLTR